MAWSHRSGGLHYGSSRSPRNASRYLILGLSALVGIGAFFYLKNLKSSRGDARETVAPAAGNEAARVAAAREVRAPSGALLAPGNPATKPVALVTVGKPAAAKAAATAEVPKAVAQSPGQQAPTPVQQAPAKTPGQTAAPIQASATTNLPPDRLVA